MPFQYIPNYVAAWPDAATTAMLSKAGITKAVHLTTFFDGYGQLPHMPAYKWEGVKQATIVAIEEWRARGKLRLLVAVVAPDHDWSKEINRHYRGYNAREDLPHVPHVTLMRDVPIGTAKGYQFLVGRMLTFDRHGGDAIGRHHNAQLSQ